MRRRLRALHVGERDFTWRAGIGAVQGDGGSLHRCINVRIWGDGKNSRALEVDLLSKDMGVGWAPAETDGSYPSAADIRRLIEHALTSGWEPDVRGGTFLLTEDHGLELPDFLVTDRVRDLNAADPTSQVIQAQVPARQAGAWQP
ncbi:hypothetical protein DL991_40320 [Amycolatopsis sp. WAC 01375]|uniref:hypothetical protein n=1 Tax=Amycolatopsis sp. WAC 01375 TaxID=2203194 RepID=UPI000F7A70FE|nr:hypothetical protein [Amycolatopsis sp. WAC 01375]RSM69412.1 hypothetical protein DL991_40320 [Amycolatopsis sp. WAC 01375]